MQDFKNLLFLDIETVSGRSAFDELSQEMQAQWLNKARYIKPKEEDQSQEEVYFNQAAIYAEFGKVICISLGVLYFDQDQKANLRIKGIGGEDEQALLQQFISLIHEKTDEKKLRLCGHNIKEFDLPYLCRRMLVHGIALPPYLQLSGKKPWEITHQDTMEMWKFGDYKHFTAFSLLTQIFGIPSPKNDISGADVNRVYYHEKDLERIVKYCNQDVLATAQVYLKLKGLPIIEESKVSYADWEGSE